MNCQYHLCSNTLSGRQKNYCSLKCKNKVMVNRRRAKLKVMAIDYKGGQCMHCGYHKCNSAMEFHHKDPKQKDFGFSVDGHTRGWEIVKLELDKCILLCANCHREEHERLRLI